MFPKDKGPEMAAVPNGICLAPFETAPYCVLKMRDTVFFKHRPPMSPVRRLCRSLWLNYNLSNTAPHGKKQG
jgi:hypothetical protein